MMVLVSLSFSHCVNFVGRGQVLVLVLNLLVLVYGLERFGLDNNTAFILHIIYHKTDISQTELR